MNNQILNLSVLVIGILATIGGLAFLVFYFKGAWRPDGQKANKNAVKAADTEKAAAAVDLGAPGAVFQGISPESLAAITAAIAAVWQGEQGFVVRHVKRISNAPAWNRAGREEQMYSRF